MARKQAFFIIVCSTLLFIASDSVRGESNVRKRKINGKEYQSERDEQEKLFNYYFRKRELKYETNFSKLKKKATLPKWRIPYSASIHPETGGGLAGISSSRGLFGRRRISHNGSSVLSKYDSAFNGGRGVANGWETSRLVTTRRAFFRGNRQSIDSEDWEGYCSGFTASTIKHPEPVRSVDASKVGGRAGVVFYPSEIKALLCAIYNRTIPDSYLYLAPASSNGGPNMGTFHLALANYIGSAEYPIGIDRTKGRVSWNNPIYSYKVTSVKDAGNHGDVYYKLITNTITYTYYGSDSSVQTDRETGNRVGQRKQSMTMRYYLELDKDGNITGGQSRSASGHFLWIPLYAVQALRNQKFPGNPGLDVRKVIALARASALPKVQAKYDKFVIGDMIDPNLLAREKAARDRVAKKARDLAEKKAKAKRAKELAAKKAKEKKAAELAAKRAAAKKAAEKRQKKAASDD